MSEIKAIVSAYCLCSACCGEVGNPTASGLDPAVGITIAAPRRIPFGTWVRIHLPNGTVIRRRVDDRTHVRYDGRWDLLVNSHRKATKWGLVRATIVIE